MICNLLSLLLGGKALYMIHTSYWILFINHKWISHIPLQHYNKLHISRRYLLTQWKFALVKVLFPTHIWIALAKVTEIATFTNASKTALVKAVKTTLAPTKISPKREGKFCQLEFFYWRRNNALAIILPTGDAQVCIGKALSFYSHHCQCMSCVRKAPSMTNLTFPTLFSNAVKIRVGKSHTKLLLLPTQVRPTWQKL